MSQVGLSVLLYNDILRSSIALFDRGSYRLPTMDAWMDEHNWAFGEYNCTYLSRNETITQTGCAAETTSPDCARSRMLDPDQLLVTSSFDLDVRSTRARGIVDGQGRWPIFTALDRGGTTHSKSGSFLLRARVAAITPSRRGAARHPWPPRLSASSTRSQLEAAASSSQSDFGLCAS